MSNLLEDVTDEDVKEIFERIGPVRSCTVNYNSSGKSTGTATVVFAKKSDAELAVEEYDEAEVDGKPMRLKLVGSLVSAPVVVKKKQAQSPIVIPQQPQISYADFSLFTPAPQQSQYRPANNYQSQQHRPRRNVVARGGGARRLVRGEIEGNIC